MTILLQWSVISLLTIYKDFGGWRGTLSDIVQEKWNGSKFQTIILNRKETQATHKLITDNKEIKTTNSIKLLGIYTDDQLKFNEHISISCSKAAL